MTFQQAPLPPWGAGGLGRLERGCWEWTGGRDCRMHRGYLSSFQKQESVSRELGFVHTGPGHGNRPGALACLGLVCAQRTQKRKDRQTHQRANHQKGKPLHRRGPGLPATGSTEKRPMLAESGGLFPTPVPMSVTWGTLCRVARASQVLEAMEAHGNREGVRAAVTWLVGPGPGARCLLGLRSGGQECVRRAAGTGARTARSPCSC